MRRYKKCVADVLKELYYHPQQPELLQQGLGMEGTYYTSIFPIKYTTFPRNDDAFVVLVVAATPSSLKGCCKLSTFLCLTTTAFYCPSSHIQFLII